MVKFKLNNKNIFSTILGLLLLIIGLGAGVVLSLQPQIWSSKAQMSVDYTPGCGGSGELCCSLVNGCDGGNHCKLDGRCYPDPTPTPLPDCGRRNMNCCSFFGYKSCHRGLSCDTSNVCVRKK